MTCGIYLLKFTGTNKVYVGQSKRIEIRYRQHTLDMEQGSSNYKLQEAFNAYSYPLLEIILECSITELDDAEDEAIKIYDSVNNGLNIYNTSNEAPTYKGFGSGNSKYTKEQIIEVFKLLVYTSETFVSIESKTGVSHAIVSQISRLHLHYWLKEEFPEEYILLTNKIGTRCNRETMIDKVCAKGKGIVYPYVISPEGTEYKIDNVSKFAKEHNLAANHLNEVLNGKRKSHKGWKVCPKEQV